MNTSELINDWRPETKSLIERLQAAGFSITGANDGEEFHKFESVGQIVNVLTSVDEAHLHVRHDDCGGVAKSMWLFLVYGNEPGYLVCDYSVPTVESVAELLEKVTDEHNAEWERKGQAKAPREEIYGA